MTPPLPFFCRQQAVSNRGIGGSDAEQMLGIVKGRKPFLRKGGAG